MNVVYGICARFGGGGIGDTAYYAVQGIRRAGLLKCLFVSSNARTGIPPGLIRDWGIAGRGTKYLAARDPSGLVYYLESILFDAWMAAHLPPCDVFHGWNGMCLRTLNKARRLGAITVVERASSHPATQLRLLREEYARWNSDLRQPTWNLRRSIEEIDRADYVTVPSAFVRDSMLAADVPEERLIEIPFGVDLSRFCPAAVPSPHPFRVVFAGQVSLRKGVPYLLEAWKQLNWPDGELWIVGRLAEDAIGLWRDWRTLRGVRFIQHTPQLAPLLRQCDVFAFPSIEEGSALVTYEALACGLPVITTHNAGSVVRDGEEGFCVPIRDVGALCDRMQRLRDDSALRATMGGAALQRARAFTWERYQERLVEAYRERVIGRKCARENVDG